jgi:flagellar protein FlaG
VPETAGAAQASHHEESVQLELSDLAKQAVSNRAKDAPKAEVGLADAIKTMREYIKNLPSDLQFTTDNDSGYVICRVINPVTREVIRQYPPEELIEMARRLRSLGDSGSKSGALLDKEL